MISRVEVAVPERRHRARRGDGSLLRTEILAAAARLLAERRDAARVSIRAIAEACGITPPSIYLHFRDKEAVLYEACAEGYREIAAHVEDAAAGIDDPTEKMRAAARAYVRYALDNPEQYRILFMQRAAAPEGADPDDLPGMTTFRSLERRGGAGGATGRFRDVDPFLTATTVWLALHGIVSRTITSQGPAAFPWPDPDALVEHLVDLAMSGMLAR